LPGSRRRLWGMCCLHLQDWRVLFLGRISRPVSCVVLTWLSLKPEDRGSTLLRNFSGLLSEDTALHPRCQDSWKKNIIRVVLIIVSSRDLGFLVWTSSMYCALERLHSSYSIKIFYSSSEEPLLQVSV
jgi:hypothetical protein